MLRETGQGPIGIPLPWLQIGGNYIKTLPLPRGGKEVRGLPRASGGAALASAQQSYVINWIMMAIMSSEFIQS